MTGILALQGGGPFVANDDLDRSLLAERGVERVTVLPTADAFENPSELVARAAAWGERLGVIVDPLSVYTRADALDTVAVDAMSAARAVYVVGDSPIHLRSVLNETELWSALVGVLDRDGLVVAAAGSAAALCDPMTDPRGGAFTIGLGLVQRLAVATEVETWTEERRQRTLSLADVAVVELPTGAAIVRRDGGWSTIGEVVVHGALPG